MLPLPAPGGGEVSMAPPDDPTETARPALRAVTVPDPVNCNVPPLRKTPRRAAEIAVGGDAQHTSGNRRAAGKEVRSRQGQRARPGLDDGEVRVVGPAAAEDAGISDVARLVDGQRGERRIVKIGYLAGRDAAGQAIVSLKPPSRRTPGFEPLPSVTTLPLGISEPATPTGALTQ